MSKQAGRRTWIMRMMPLGHRNVEIVTNEDRRGIERYCALSIAISFKNVF
jgi:hypothetical protein